MNCKEFETAMAELLGGAELTADADAAAAHLADCDRCRESAGQKNPSPRDLDQLEFEERDNELWVKFRNFYTGIHEQNAKL